MSPFRAFLIFSCFFCPALTAQDAIYRAPIKPFKAVVRIVALSSSARQNFAGNQDTYFAEIHTGKEYGGRLVKLVDQYSDYDYPIRRSLLLAQRPLQMRLTRDESCDTRADYMHVSYELADTFDPSLPVRLEEQGTTLLPCFAVAHGATRLSK